ncbi:hypothetical protein [Dactylosporangium sp. CA-233914]|uniref:hypothetical protein n=1 Tax=Dactylosporangium sp. CA-233914 TaxID=3239934 RepID=UPI003D8F6BEE
MESGDDAAIAESSTRFHDQIIELADNSLLAHIELGRQESLESLAQVPPAGN